MVNPSAFVAFGAGLVSFLSPCVMPLIPGFLAYLSGTSVGQSGARLKIFLNSVAFVLGFSVVFALLGVMLNTVLERVSYDAQIWLGRVGGIIIILFALNVLKILNIKALQKEHKLKISTQFSITYITSFAFGAAFAVGWTPCVSAILGSILALTVSQPGLAFLLLMSYALGLGLPFLIVGAFTNEAMDLINRSHSVLKYFNLVVGIFLLILGILVFFNSLNRVASFESLMLLFE